MLVLAHKGAGPADATVVVIAGPRPTSSRRDRRPQEYLDKSGKACSRSIRSDKADTRH